MLDDLYYREGVIGLRNLANDLDKKKFVYSKGVYPNEATQETLKNIDNDLNTVLSYIMGLTFGGSKKKH